MSLTPRRGQTAKAEWAITLACDLECAACTRASFLRRPATAPMTLDDAREFCRQARELDWRPSIIIIGGEPTLSPDFEAFVDVAVGFSGRPQVWSNGRTAAARAKLDRVRDRASIVADTHKDDSVTEAGGKFPGWTLDMFVSPSDHPGPKLNRLTMVRDTCYQHGGTGPRHNPGICGISVDHEGYAPCALGGAIDSVLRLGVRTRRLADLFDEEKVGRMSEDLCRHCGFQGVVQGFVDSAALDKCDRSRFGTPMSETWRKAFEGRK